MSVHVRVGDIVEARLTPIFTDDLRPEAWKLMVDREVLRWTAARVIDYSETYDGQLRMELGREDHTRTGLWWTPLCDLSDVVVVGVDTEVAEMHALLYRGDPA